MREETTKLDAIELVALKIQYRAGRIEATTRVKVRRVTD